jgi:hypothetical protein
MKVKLEKFIITECSPNDFDDIKIIQDETIEELTSVDMLRQNTDEMLMECLHTPNVTLGAWYEETLAAFSVLYYPFDDAENLAQYLEGINSTGLKTANNKLCIVRRKFRGNALQYELGHRLDTYAIKSGVKLMCATVSPHNTYSINNVLRLGYVYNRTLQKYNYERNLYYRYISI